MVWFGLAWFGVFLRAVVIVCGQPVSEASKKVSESQEKSTKERAPRPSPLSSHNQQACDLAETDFENGETKTLRPHLYYNYPTLGLVVVLQGFTDL
eukprot:s125_g12.t1